MTASDLADLGFTDGDHSSKFTFRDLKNLSRSASCCPLRVITLIDFDAFYAQCETVRLGLSQDQPLAVQQWGALIAVNYAAKAEGVQRLVSPDGAKAVCPSILLQHVATWREGDSSWAYRDDVRQHMRTDKAALDPYRLQSQKALRLVKRLLPPSPLQRVERASIDEFFLDLSAQVHRLLLVKYPDLLAQEEDANSDLFLPLPQTTLLDWQNDNVVDATDDAEVRPADWDDVALCIGAEIVRDLRQQIYSQLHYTCSAGIAHNKTMAKLAAGHRKPNRQTVVRARAIPNFLSGYKFTKIRGLARKLGHEVVQAFGTDSITQLLNVDLQDLRRKLGDHSGTWVFNIIRGIDSSEVVERTELQSMLAAKTFVPKASNLEQAEKWLRIFSGDLMGRMHDQDASSTHRRPKTITVNHAIDGRFGPTRSKQMHIPTGVEINAQLLFDLSRKLLIEISQQGPTWPCLGVSMSVSGFEDSLTKNHHITSFFGGGASTELSMAHAPDRIHELQQSSSGSLATKRTFSAAFDPNETLHSSRQQKMRLVPSHSHLVDADSATEVTEAVNGYHGTPYPEPVHAAYPCPKCGEDIDPTDVLEHLDWHVAMELQ